MEKFTIGSLLRRVAAGQAGFWLCIILAAYSALMPFYRTFLLLEVNYNEGWNAYTAAAFAHHAVLYPAHYGWTTANYPVLSFFIVTHLSEFTHDYVFTGRALSLLGLLLCCAFTGAIVHRLTTSLHHGVLAGFLCLTIFCANACSRMGMDDPQMFAQLFFMAGLFVYVVHREKSWSLFLIALLFVAGGNIKQNLIDFPLAIALDLWLVNKRRLALFLGFLVLLELPAFYLNIRLGGPGFVTQLLVPRRFIWTRLFKGAFDYYIVLLIPIVGAVVSAVRAYRDKAQRVIAIFFAVSVLVGLLFGGGAGVSINAYFSSTLAMAMLLGLFMYRASIWGPQWPDGSAQWGGAVSLGLFFWMLIPMQCDNILFPIQNWERLQAQQQRFVKQVSFLRAQTGQSLCESLLLCYYAGKPYELDPFNSTSLIAFGKLDESTLVNGIRNQQYSAIQFDKPPLRGGLPDAPPERFTPATLRAVQENYVPALQDLDCTVYVPRRRA